MTRKKVHSDAKEEDEEGNVKPKSDVVEEVELEDVNMEQEKTKFEESHREAYEEEDDDHRRGHSHHAQGCRTQ